MPYRLAILDFDGTLADSAGWFRCVINDVAREFGFRTVSDEDFARLRGQDNRAIVRHLGVPAWKLPLIARHMRGLARREAHRIRPFDGAIDALRGLKASGAVVAIVSSNDADTIRRILGPEGVACVDRIEGGASLFGKAAKFRRVLRATGIPPAEALAIGDEVRDIEAAAAAGIDSAAVAWGYADPELLRARGPTLLLERMEAIPTHFRG